MNLKWIFLKRGWGSKTLNIILVHVILHRDLSTGTCRKIIFHRKIWVFSSTIKIIINLVEEIILLKKINFKRQVPVDVNNVILIDM